MPDIYDLHKTYGVSIRVLRRMAKDGILKVSEINPEFRKMKENLRAGRRLTVAQCLYLLRTENRNGLEHYEAMIDRRLDELGDVEAEAMPAASSAYVYLAAARDKSAIVTLAGILASYLDTARMMGDKSHAWLACRLLWNSPEPDDARLVNAALMRVRHVPEFRAYWHKAENGIIFYHRKISVDL